MVAPIRRMFPASTCGRNASCCARLKRCISSTKTMVRRPYCRAHLGLRHHFFNFFDSGEHGAEGNELGLRAPRDDARERRLAAAGRAPEEHRAHVVALDLRAQRLARPEQLFLADEFVERLRTHPVGERPACERLFFGLDGVKKSHEGPLAGSGWRPDSRGEASLIQASTKRWVYETAQSSAAGVVGDSEKVKIGGNAANDSIGGRCGDTRGVRRG